jgi:hypothetical protein
MAEGLSSLGQRVARRFIVRGVRSKPSDVAGELGVEVILEASPPPAQPGLRSEYRAEPPRIIVYTDSLERIAVAVHVSQRFDMMRCDLVELHIAHELFHHLEFGGRFGRLGKEEVEAAAHDFARELLDLDFDPRELPSGRE